MTNVLYMPKCVIDRPTKVPTPPALYLPFTCPSPALHAAPAPSTTCQPHVDLVTHVHLPRYALRPSPITPIPRSSPPPPSLSHLHHSPISTTRPSPPLSHPHHPPFPILTHQPHSPPTTTPPLPATYVILPSSHTPALPHRPLPPPEPTPSRASTACTPRTPRIPPANTSTADYVRDVTFETSETPPSIVWTPSETLPAATRCAARTPPRHHHRQCSKNRRAHAWIPGRARFALSGDRCSSSSSAASLTGETSSFCGSCTRCAVLCCAVLSRLCLSLQPASTCLDVLYSRARRSSSAASAE